MDQRIIERLRQANAAAVSLTTLLVMGEDDEAIATLLNEIVYADPATTMALATLATSAIKALAQVSGSDPMEVMQMAGLSAARYAVELEKKGESDAT